MAAGMHEQQQIEKQQHEEHLERGSLRYAALHLLVLALHLLVPVLRRKQVRYSLRRWTLMGLKRE